MDFPLRDWRLCRDARKADGQKRYRDLEKSQWNRLYSRFQLFGTEVNKHRTYLRKRHHRYGDRLNQLIVSMVEKIAFELRRQEKLTSCFTVKIRYSNFDTHTLQKRIPYTSFDHVLAGIAKELFVRLYQRRMLIRLIGVRFSHMVRGVQQLDLFDDTPEKVSLYMAMDKLRKRFGRYAVRRASGVMTYKRKGGKGP